MYRNRPPQRRSFSVVFIPFTAVYGRLRAVIQMLRLLANCNGRSLMYLHDFMTNGQIQQILSLLQEDSLRRIKENLSLIEVSCFRALMDEQKQQLLELTNGTKLVTYF